MSRKNSGPQFFKPAKKTGNAQMPRRAPVELTVERFSGEGRGIAFRDGKPLFIAGALAGERVRARIVAQKKDFAEAELIDVLDAAPQRIAPRCELFGRCGGCQLQMLGDADQLAHKRQSLQHLLRHFGGADMESSPITAAPWHYRHRARLTVAEIDGAPVLGFKSAGSHAVIAVTACAILDERLQPLLRTVPQWLAQLSQWRRIDEVLLCIDSRGRIALAWHAQRAFPRADAEKFAALCRAADVSVGADALLAYEAESQGTSIAFAPDDFTQVNPAVNDRLAARTIEWLEPGANDRIADFFCGLGNFTLPIARHARDVHGYDNGAAMIGRATANAESGDFTNANFYAVDLFDAAALDAVLRDEFDKALLDPPRAGAKVLCERLRTQKKLRRIVYVSCNPQTLARDIALLAEGGFTLRRTALVDMFPQTGHSEAMVLLER